MNLISQSEVNFQNIKSAQLLRVDSVAKLMACSKSQVWYLTKQGDLKSIKLSERITVWHQSDIEDFIASKIGA